MQEFNDFWTQADSVARAVAALLLLMSISAWVLIFWKSWVLKRAATDLRRAVPAFWDAGTVGEGRARLGQLDRESLLLPLPGGHDARANIGRGFTRALTGNFAKFYRRHFDMQINAIKKRSADALSVACDLHRIAAALTLGISIITAGTIVHGSDQEKF
mgnify:CR=1 FL=1